MSVFTSKIIIMVKEDYLGLNFFVHYDYKVNTP